MSLYGMMRTSASGMAAQASRISTVSDNVANSSTTGYKQVESEFSSLVIAQNIGEYESGSVDVTTRRDVSGQGTLVGTTSPTDLGIEGTGFFIVQGADGQTVLTRAGSFTPNASNQLVNAAGFKLLAYPASSANAGSVTNGYAGLVPVTVAGDQLTATPTSKGNLTVNLPNTDVPVAAANLPSTNAASSTYSEKSSLVVYGNQGQQVTLDIYSTKVGSNTWEVSIFDRAGASGSAGFPYSSAPLATQTLAFDASSGQLAPGSATSLSISVPGGHAMSLDLSGTSQLAAPYSVITSSVNGNGVSNSNGVEIGKDGLVYVDYDNGTKVPRFRIPMSRVPSTDNLDALTGNVFSYNERSGLPQIGFPQDPGFGSINAGTLEQSTADIASQFTEMIDAQRSYTANSKVFQTGADLMDVLMNLKR